MAEGVEVAAADETFFLYGVNEGIPDAIQLFSSGVGDDVVEVPVSFC